MLIFDSIIHEEILQELEELENLPNYRKLIRFFRLRWRRWFRKRKWVRKLRRLAIKLLVPAGLLFLAYLTYYLYVNLSATEVVKPPSTDPEKVWVGIICTLVGLGLGLLVSRSLPAKKTEPEGTSELPAFMGYMFACLIGSLLKTIGYEQGWV